MKSKEIDRQVRAGNGVAFDLLAFMYLAAFDGYLNAYDAPTLREMGAQLKRSAIAAEGYVEYGGMRRNFADYAFHMVHMLEDPAGVVEAREGGPAPPRSRLRR